jgi:ATP-binding cassette subfamily C protein LapB
VRRSIGTKLLYNPTLIACSVVLNLLTVALPIFTLQVYDRVIPNAATDTLLLLTILLFTLLLGEGALRAVRSALAGWAGARYEHNAGCAGVERLLAAELRAAEADTIGSHVERLSAIDRLREFYTNQGAMIAIDLPFALLFAGIIWMIGGPLVWVTVAVFAAFALAATVIGRALHNAIEARTDSDKRRISFMVEVLSGITTVKAMTMERLMMRRYERLMDSASTAAHSVTYLSSLSQALGTFFSNLATVAVVTYGAILVLDQQMTIGQLACCSLLAGRVMQPLLRAMGIWSNFQAIRLAEEQIDRIFDLPQEPGGLRGRATPIVRDGAIEFRGVRFDDGSNRVLLDSADLSIRAGETIGLVVADGRDRSAVLSLIAGLLRPTGGQILYDGVPLQPTDPRPGPDEIGLLPRHAAVFQGSLIDNLTNFRRGEPVDMALQLAERLGLDRYVASLANGYESLVTGGETETLPGGVRQRIGIIRALVDRPQIVLFDESNNGLDRASNDRLLQMLAEMKGKVTLVLISYQPSVLRLADRMFELRDGRFVARPAVAAAATVASIR